MLINDVESIVGLSKKSIRYYEEMGLINPERNSNNGYRFYNEFDIRQLKIIKFLRELGVPIQELKKVIKKELSLRECVESRLMKIAQERRNYERVTLLCQKILESNDSIETIQIDQYFQSMNVLNKEGFTMRKIEEEHKKKINGAIYSGIGFCIFMGIFVALLLFAQSIDPMPWPLFIVLESFFVIPILIVPKILINRIQEIKKGEIDEASKY
ncbi:MerR family transcriptional regulator [Floccifex sp.]|uniref:MerR family transcriptional regulator n=1 Tax=Floccifex sp. TaxID=2815810 RepID=UPI003F0B3142